ncbi:polycystic kidney disease 1-like 2 [Paramuricea clavata]|uniref:Polycystic kidney disease 1-like 2 n=1 Tax=Paramuricea clavata TaxID=317549 RepID=A0A7D9DU11_PARCT|nr:polycystic kidney disease 1-like 2 [Paramuricea clavata]
MQIVVLGTNREQILCKCNHLTSFGSELFVAPNPSDFDSVFNNFGSLAQNVAVLALISTILGGYIIGVIWARRADKRDLLMVGPTILTKPKGSYHYLITTYTGSRRNAGTTAKVIFKMSGDKGETYPVRLRDRYRPCFERQQESAFVISYPQGIGDLSYVQIWHDNSGSSPSWYLSRILVKDLQTEQMWSLFCENWLAVESEDGKVCRILPVANEEEMTNFSHLFSARAIKGLADGHIWFSIVSRPPTSNFTRVQRLSCALCLLCCTMITSAMFYNMGEQRYYCTAGKRVLITKADRYHKPARCHRSTNINQSAQTGNTLQYFSHNFERYCCGFLSSNFATKVTIGFAIQWGKETSTEWVIAMVTSFLQSALLLQPVKVVVLAVVFAIFIRKPPPPPREGEKVKKYLSPPDPTKLKRARAKRLKEIKMNAALTEIFVFFFFLVCLMDVAQYHRDPNTYLLSKTLSETFVNVDSFSIPLDWIVDADSLWMWSRETLIPGLYAGKWYNGKKIEKGYIANMEDYLVGIPRVRMVRVKNGTCTVSSYFEDTIPECNSQYSVANRDDKNYNRTKKNGWKVDVDPIQSGRNHGHILSCLQRWRHQSMLELRGFPYWGTIATYGGSGYAANLGYDQLTAYTVVADLHSNGWISKQTRAVFVEFTVYNANTNLFGIISILIEYPSSTGVVNKVQLQAARFYLQLNGGQTLAHVLVIFFMLYFLYREGKVLYKQRWNYFKGFWNWVETILVISQFSLIVLFLARLYEVDRNLLQLRENPNDYVAFQYAGQADATMTTILGILVFFYILRFLRLLRFNKNFLIIGTTLSRISEPIFSFFVPFQSGYLAFALFAFSVFGSELEDYSTFVRTMVTQFSMTLGDFDFEALMSVSVVFGSLYFFAFIGLNVIVLMNMFIAIIDDSYAEVQEETAEKENEFELVDYVVGKIIEKFTRSKPSQRRRKRKEERCVKNNNDAKLIATNKCFSEVDLICNKLDKLFETIENGVKEDNKIETQICSVPEEKKDSYYEFLCLIESDVVEDCKSPFSPADLYAKYVEIMYLN